MRPNMFQWRDLLLVGPCLIVIGLCAASIIYNLIVGNPLPAGGIVAACAATVGCAAVIAFFYAQRYNWVRKWRYEVLGVGYYFEDGSTIYVRDTVMQDVVRMLSKWAAYYKVRSDGQVDTLKIMAGRYVEGAKVVFRPEFPFKAEQPGMWNRLVTGLKLGEVCYVGQGGRPVEATAHAHELSHYLLEQKEGGRFSEEQAHAIFKEVGV